VSPTVVPKPQESAEQRRQALAEANTRVDEAEALGRVADDLRRDIGRIEQQRDALAKCGQPIEDLRGTG
jgi:hypothetical protein